MCHLSYIVGSLQVALNVFDQSVLLLMMVISREKRIWIEEDHCFLLLRHWFVVIGTLFSSILGESPLTLIKTYLHS